MTWSDKLLPGRFRGVRFFIESSDRAGGRRTVDHEYPLRDLNYVQDMGRGARVFEVDCLVVDKASREAGFADYFAHRDALISALENQTGPGQLDHPYHGTRSAICTGFRVREQSSEGGIARFAITFKETPAQPFSPVSTPDVAGAIRTAADALQEVISGEFLRKFTSLPSAFMSSVHTTMRQATRAINNATRAFEMPEQELARLRQRTTDLEDSVTGLANEPEDMVAAFEGIFELIDDPDALVEVYGFNAGTRPPGATPSRLQEQVNYDETQRLVQRLAAVQAARVLPDQTFESYDQALAKRQAITDMLDEQIEVVADDVYPELQQLRADLVRGIPGPDSDLPHLVEHTPHVSVPSIVLTWDLYGSLDREEDLVLRNRVRNPAAVPGGRALEVLSK
jgi:prophage DNA circulation protein